MKHKQEAKQLVRFPYCRIYRRFVNRLADNPQIRKQGQGLLYRYIALFSLANFRSAIRTIHGQRHVMQAGEWVASYGELCHLLHLRTHKQLREILARLEALRLIETIDDPRQKILRFKITCWPKTNTTLPYSAPCPKDMGFFFFPIKQLSALIGTDRCSEADMLLDLWLNTVFQDSVVPGSDLCPVVYLRGENRLPFVSCSTLATRWKVSKTTVHRVLKKFESLGLLRAYHCAGKHGSVLTLRGYLSVMFCLHDALPSEEALTARMNFPAESTSSIMECSHEPSPLPDALTESVSKPEVPLILENLRNALFASGFRCSACPHALYRLSNLSDCKEEIHPYDLAIFCGSSGALYHFSLKLEPAVSAPGVEVEVI